MVPRHLPLPSGSGSTAGGTARGTAGIFLLSVFKRYLSGTTSVVPLDALQFYLSRSSGSTVGLAVVPLPVGCGTARGGTAAAGVSPAVVP